MNTQRPEWNDANNALVGHGISMVTLYYLRRFIVFFQTLLRDSLHQGFVISAEVYSLFQDIFKVFKDHQHLLVTRLSDSDRKHILDLLGKAGEVYREELYKDKFTTLKVEITTKELIEFCILSIEYIDHSIQANRRSDHLFHSYNLMELQGDTVSVHHLYEMLEGQVALLSSGYLGAAQTLELLGAMKCSRLFRKDQNSFMLYPDRQLPHFIEKNNIHERDVNSSVLLRNLIQSGKTDIITRDVFGNFHFNSKFRNVMVLREALDELRNSPFASVAQEETEHICSIYESIFNHRAFTGRSGTFYKYEGLGCIYWHMVAKLLPAIQETFFQAIQTGEDQTIISGLYDVYYEIREGLGVQKSPSQYGAFPTDPYSHTPGNLGVQQPGMTGQVKEDIISRFGELGIFINNGRILFNPKLLRKSEFLTVPQLFTYYDLQGTKVNLNLGINTLAFTYCQVPVVYHLAKNQKIVLSKIDGILEEQSGFYLDAQISHGIFNRKNHVKKIDVYISL